MEVPTLTDDSRVLGQSRSAAFISQSKTTGGSTQLSGGLFIYFVNRQVSTTTSTGSTTTTSVLSDNNDPNPTLNTLSASVTSPVFYFPNEQQITLPAINNGTYDIFILGYSDSGFGVTGHTVDLYNSGETIEQPIGNTPILTGIPYCGRAKANNGVNADGSITLSGGAITLTSLVGNDFCSQIKSAVPTNVTYLPSSTSTYANTLQQPYAPGSAGPQVAAIFSNWLVPFTMNLGYPTNYILTTLLPNFLTTPASRYSDIQQIQTIQDANSQNYYGIQDDNPNSNTSLSKRFAYQAYPNSIPTSNSPTGLANIFTPTYFIMCGTLYSNSYALQSQDFSYWYPYSTTSPYISLCPAPNTTSSATIGSVQVVLGSDTVLNSGSGIFSTTGGTTNIAWKNLLINNSQNLAPVSMCIPLLNQVPNLLTKFDSDLGMQPIDALSKQIAPAFLPTGNVSSFNGTDVNPLRMPTWVFAYPNTNCSNAPSRLYEFTPNLSIVQEKFYRNPTQSQGVSSTGSGQIDLSQNIRVYTISDPSNSGTGTLVQTTISNNYQTANSYALPAEIMDWNFATTGFTYLENPNSIINVPYVIASITYPSNSTPALKQMYSTRIKLIVLH
jgi:hypothetical protein